MLKPGDISEPFDVHSRDPVDCKEVTLKRFSQLETFLFATKLFFLR